MLRGNFDSGSYALTRLTATRPHLLAQTRYKIYVGNTYPMVEFPTSVFEGSITFYYSAAGSLKH